MSTPLKAVMAVCVLALVAALAFLWTEEDGGAAGTADVLSQQERSPVGTADVPAVPAAVRDGATTPLTPVAAGGDLDTEAGGAAQTAVARLVDAPQVTLRGRVLDELGAPVAGAEVTFLGQAMSLLQGPGSRGRPPEADRPSSRTDQSGRFELEAPVPDQEQLDDGFGLLRREPTLVVVHDAFATKVHACGRLEPGEADLGDLFVEGGAWISGRAVDPDGRPLADVIVTGFNTLHHEPGADDLMPMLFGSIAESFTRMTTGDDGRFVVRGLRPGSAGVRARKDGHRPGVAGKLELTAHAGTQVGDVTLELGETIAGYVLDDKGNPVEGAVVRVSSMTHIVINNMEDMPHDNIGHDLSLRAETDALGAFELAGLAAGSFTVHVSADGFSRGREENVAAGRQDLRIYLEPLGSILLSVRSARDGSPVDDAEIFAHRVRNSEWGSMVDPDELEVVTGREALVAAGHDVDPAGHYLLLGAGPDGNEITVSADGFALTKVEAPEVVSGGSIPFRMELLPETIVAGRVIDAAGDPVDRARVRVREPGPQEDFLASGGGRFEVRREVRMGGPDESMQAALTTWTDADGNFEVRGLAPGDWEIVARADTFVPSDPFAVSLAEGEARRDLELQLQPGGSILGHVYEADGEPVAGMRVTASASKPAQGGDELEMRIQALMAAGDDESVTTDEDGAYRFDGLAPGRYEVKLAPAGVMRMGGAMVFSFDGADTQEGEVYYADVEAAGETVLDLVRPLRGEIRGRLAAAGRPLEGVTVSLNEAAAFLPMGGETTKTDRYGEFAFEDVAPGAYKLAATAPGAGLEESVEVEVDAGETRRADLTFEGATIAGHVIDIDGDRGAQGVTVTVSPVKDDAPGGFAFGGPGGGGGGNVRIAMVTQIDDGGGGGGMHMEIGGGSISNVRTDADGYFELKYMKPGEYLIEASGNGYGRSEIGPIEVPDDLLVDDVEIEVARGAVIEGVVRSGKSGDPLARMMLMLVSEGDRQTGFTEPDGSYRFEGLDVGTYQVQVMGSAMAFGGGEPVASGSVSLDPGEVATLDLTTDD